jgi:hypothetical protein
LTSGKILAIAGLMSGCFQFIGLGMAAAKVDAGLTVAFIGATVMLAGNLAALGSEGVKVYKIRDPGGWFSAGGCFPTFSKLGRAWTKAGLVAHLGKVHRPDTYAGCQVVTYELTETGRQSPGEFLLEHERSL